MLAYADVCWRMLTYATLNEIDGSAKSVIKDLAELERDLKERMEMAEKMGTQFTCFTSTISLLALLVR
jgi:hypothetical protein